jgi:hypothetical protein
VSEFDGEPECSPQVMQVGGGMMRHPMFTCKFGCRTKSDLRSPPAAVQATERKGCSVLVHDLSGSPVALTSMVTPFVASPRTDRVSRGHNTQQPPGISGRMSITRGIVADWEVAEGLSPEVASLRTAAASICVREWREVRVDPRVDG